MPVLAVTGLLSSSAQAAGQAPPRSRDSLAAIVSEIERLDSVWMIGAHLTPRSAEWAAVLDQGFRRTSLYGAFESKTQLQQRLRRLPVDSTARYLLREVRVQVSGESAESSGWFLILDAEGRVIAAAPYTNVYARRSGSWLVLTSFWGS